MSSAKKHLTDLGQKAGQTLAQEPFEMLKTGVGQVTGVEALSPQNTSAPQEGKPQVDTGKLEEEDKQRSKRLIEALQRELTDIANAKASHEAERKEDENKEEEPRPPLVEPSTKKPRGFRIFGPKQKAESLKTRVEKPPPLTG